MVPVFALHGDMQPVVHKSQCPLMGQGLGLSSNFMLATTGGMPCALGQSRLKQSVAVQGQEGPAEAILDKYTKEGGWVFLDNVHLMQGWIPNLERKLEIAAETAHPDFRCFFSAEPINGAPQAKIVPESILQTCIKISNEPPSDMRSNMRRAFAAFNQEMCSR